MLTELERKELARNIRHRLADMFGNQWKGALDAAVNEMLLDEIDKFLDGIDEAILPTEDADVSCIDTGNDGSPDWPLRKRNKT